VRLSSAAWRRRSDFFDRGESVDTPESLKYTASHEWVARHADGTASVGITAVAAEQLGELVYVKLPEAGMQVRRGDAVAVVESTKAASDVYAPLSGTVIAANEALEANPGEVNNSPYGSGWLFKLRIEDDGELKDLLDAAQYRGAAGTQ
jgi:glycine cleavage system H protein